VSLKKKPTHLSEEGKARMVDVTSKEATAREARARAFVRMSPGVLEAVREGGLEKGDALGVARLAGMMAAKRTAELIPLCHPIPITGIDVEAEVMEGGVEIVTAVKTTAPTGVEMEALVAASTAALAVYDMVKSVDRSVTIEGVELTYKAGGKSGTWKRDD
jgi:cyclic pyranopterin phosphate synthase